MTESSPYWKWFSYKVRRSSKSINKVVSRDAKRKVTVRADCSNSSGTIV